MMPPDSVNQTLLNEFKKDNLEGSAEMYSSILEIFLNDAPKMIAEIKDSLEKGDAAGAKGPAHNLKSNSAALGAQGLSKIAKQMEAAAIENQFDTVKGLYQEIVEEFEKVKPFFEYELSSAQSEN